MKCGQIFTIRLNSKLVLTTAQQTEQQEQ